MTRVPAGLTRRVVLGVPLAAAPAVLLTACGGESKSGGITPQQVAAGDLARGRALAAERDLMARYDAALALPGAKADQALTDRLTAIRAEHAAHATALAEGTKPGSVVPGAAAAPGAASPAQTAGTPGATPATPTSPAAPADAKTAVSGLVKAERDAADRLTADVLATEGHTAQLLASIAASESGHAALLGGAA